MAVTFRKKRAGSKKRKSSTRRKTKTAARRRTYRRRKATRKNPARKRRRMTASRVRTSPRSVYKRRKARRTTLKRTNPRRKRRSRRVRRNPAMSLKKAFSMKVLGTAAKTGAGIAIGFSAMPFVYRIAPQALKDRRQYLGLVHVTLGLAVAGFIKNRHAKDIGLVVAATGMYDLIAMNVPALGLPALRTSSELSDKLLPTSETSEAQAGNYGGQLDISHYGASYPTPARAVSPVAARGVGANYETMGASYPSMAYPTVGLSSDLGMDDCIN